MNLQLASKMLVGAILLVQSGLVTWKLSSGELEEDWKVGQPRRLTGIAKPFKCRVRASYTCQATMRVKLKGPPQMPELCPMD